MFDGADAGKSHARQPAGAVASPHLHQRAAAAPFGREFREFMCRDDADAGAVEMHVIGQPQA
jgi:hypothetical protein